MTTETAGTSIEQIFREVSPTLWHAVYTYSGGRREVADDAVAEAFARAIEHLEQIRNPAPWLYRTAFRIAGRELARGARTTPLDGVDPGFSPGEHEDLTRLLRGLSPSQRAAIYLHYQADLPVRQIARLMGTSAAAVRVHLYRGRGRLRELLEGETDD